uniref:NADH-ubiquinone oxidoreductase chain 2 n=1 Tax=Micrurus fulvius TaxID=8637 RepID=Q8W9X5_MICFL|nr:NADH dehydrogenase subunit 2 [Micrurus fulvius]AAL66832.1 NADH dehydrogenase subunit 2 [Micrurus fulvius]ACY09609.1 NADH dehydrogenase subunit 2 [Micrurus fulvius]
MNLTSWSVITTSIIMSTLLTTIATHWLMVWVCLEINTLSMIPVISKPYHPRATEAATKYYLTQITASTTLLFATTVNAMNTSNWETHITTDPMTTTIITLTLMMKMAAAPFHFWLPEVTQGTTTLTALAILTWQKIAPLTVMLTTHNKMNQTLLLMSAILSVITGGLGSLNQTQLRKLMAFSSIAHTGWIIATMTTSPKISALTFMIYTMATAPIFLAINHASTTTIKDMSTMRTTSPHLMLVMVLTILSLGGLPPLTGFMPKWLILNKLTSTNMIIEATTMAMASMLSLFIYLKLTYMLAMTLPPHTTPMLMKWRTPHKKYPMPMAILTVMTALLLPLSPNM